MAPQTKVQCFAVKDKKAKLERWEFEPVPLQPHDVGEASNIEFSVDTDAVTKHTNMCKPHTYTPRHSPR